jgi:hypothetical protein
MAEEKINEEKKEEKAQKKGLGFKVFFWNFLLSFSLSTILLICYHFFVFQKRVVEVKVFDLMNYLAILQKAYVSGQISQAELIDVLKEIKSKLDAESERNVIILPANIVLNKAENRKIELDNSKFFEIKRRVEEIEKKPNQ